VWTNIIDNAIDALDSEGVITLRTRAEGDSVVVEIEDNGPGILEDVQGRVFDAFFTTKPPGKRTGLGLDTTYGIVAYKHHGDISVASEPGKTVSPFTCPSRVTRPYSASCAPPHPVLGSVNAVAHNQILPTEVPYVRRAPSIRCANRR
jgi:signal transduction histidine kinase